MHRVHSFAAGVWVPPSAGARPIESAITGEVIGEAGNDALDVQAMRAYAQDKGGAALRAMTFHDRARMLKALALLIREHRQTLYDLSFDTGATQADHLIDIDGGIGTMLVFASKGRREMPDGHVYLDGSTEQLGRAGHFQGCHICTPLQGAALHINAFNFPVWGMLEKIAPTLLAGMPAIVKPATATSYVTEACVRLMTQSGLLPDGALQLISGGVGDLLGHMDCQDVVTFTGSAKTAQHLRSNANMISNSVRFTAEQDSLNASILGPDAIPGTPEFDLFIKEVWREMTIKTGQKCTAIRRIMVPQAQVDAVIGSLDAALSQITLGDPRAKKTKMGPLVSNAQKKDVLEKVRQISTEAEQAFGELSVGDTLRTPARQVTLDDIETFAHFTGDTFYAHMDDDAAKANPFFPGRVAHGYLLLSFAAGLFVHPDPGPVLANTGLDNLRFMKPVEPGDSIKVRLTVKSKTNRNSDYGEVRWYVTISNQNEQAVAEYELLTMNAN